MQRVVPMRPRSAGAAVPVHLAAHVCARAASKHAGHQLFSNAVPDWRSGAMPATAAGASHRGGTFLFTFL